MISVENFEIITKNREISSSLDYRFRLSARSRNLNTRLLSFQKNRFEEAWKFIWLQGFRRGWNAVKRNIIPACIVQSLIGLLLISYYFFPNTQEFFIQVKEWKQQGGLPLCFLLMGGAAALIVESIRVLAIQKGKLNRINLNNLVFNLMVYGIWGICTQLFFNFLSWGIGSQATPLVVTLKTTVDRSLWAPLIGIPYQMGMHLWRAEGFSFSNAIHKVRDFKTFFGQNYIPLLITNQGFWIPMNFLIYSFPLPLQFPVTVLGLSLWVLLLNTVLKK